MRVDGYDVRSPEHLERVKFSHSGLVMKLRINRRSTVCTKKILVCYVRASRAGHSEQYHVMLNFMIRTSFRKQETLRPKYIADSNMGAVLETVPGNAFSASVEEYKLIVSWHVPRKILPVKIGSRKGENTAGQLSWRCSVVQKARVPVMLEEMQIIRLMSALASDRQS